MIENDNIPEIKIAIVDDHAIFRAGLIKLFRKFREMHIILEAENGLDLTNKLKRFVPDIILLDVDMPEMDGYETTKYLKEHHPEIKIIILTHHNSEQIMLHLIDLGAQGFLLKNNSIDTIVDAIYSVLDNGYYFNDKVQKKMVVNLIKEKKIKPRYDKVNLSERERDILALVVKEYNNAQISEILHIDVSTVSTHKKNIIKKTNSKNIIGAVMYGMKNNLLD